MWNTKGKPRSRSRGVNAVNVHGRSRGVNA